MGSIQHGCGDIAVRHLSRFFDDERSPGLDGAEQCTPYTDREPRYLVRPVMIIGFQGTLGARWAAR